MNINSSKIHYPKILYKYRDWDNELHKKVLLENKLYLASPKDFEDIFDCNLPEKFPRKDELYNFFIDKAKKNPSWSRQVRRKFARNWCKKSPLANPELRSTLINNIHQEFNSRFGVLSMTADCNNDVMWCKYANNHQGICIGFDTSLLFKYVGGGGKVQYVKELPPIDFAKDDFKSKHTKNIFYKEEKWSFEKEYRLHKMWNHNVTNDERNIELPNNCIVKIILGKNMTLHMKDEIKKLAKTKYPNAEIHY